LLYRMGVHAHRAGPPMLADGKPIFACWIEIDEQTMTALGIAAAAMHDQRHSVISPAAKDQLTVPAVRRQPGSHIAGSML